jgi:polysaccharide biosynthesis transport protein
MPTEMLTLNDYIAVVRRRKWVILACTVVLALAGFAYAHAKGATNQATVDVGVSYIQPPTSAGGTAGSPSASEDARFLANQVAFARTEPVLEAAAKLAAKQHVQITADALGNASSATPSTTADILSFAVRDRNRVDAEILANAYAQAYVSERWAQIDSQYGTQAANLTRQIAQMGKKLQAPSTSKTEARSIRPQLEQALKELGPLQSFVRQDKIGTQVQKTTAGVAQVKSSPSTFALIGGFVGLVIGLIAGFIWDAIDRGRTTGRDVAGTLNLPVLANIPTPPKHLSSENRLASMEPSEATAEPYRLLAVRLSLLCTTPGRQVLLITSAVDSEGKSTTAANVSVALAQMGKSVVMVDGDLLRPTAARFFGADDGPGLFEVLSGDLEIADVGVDIMLPGNTVAGGRLRVIPAGRVTGDPTGLLASDRLDAVIGEIRDSADYVIVDCTPLLTVSHAMVVSSRSDALVVITRADRVTPEISWNLQETLKAVPAMALGVVVTAADANPIYGYGYYGRISELGAPLARDGAGRLPGTLPIPGLGKR